MRNKKNLMVKIPENDQSVTPQPSTSFNNQAITNGHIPEEDSIKFARNRQAIEQQIFDKDPITKMRNTQMELFARFNLFESTSSFSPASKKILNLRESTDKQSVTKGKERIGF